MKKPKGLPSAAYRVEETHQGKFSSSSRLRWSSDLHDWASVYVSRQSEQPYQRHFSALTHPFVSIPVDATANVSVRTTGMAEQGPRRPGRFALVPPGMSFDADLTTACETLHVYLSGATLEEMSFELCPGDPDRLGLRFRFDEPDPFVEQLVRALAAAAEHRSAVSALYADQIAKSLTAHLILRHSNLSAIGSMRAVSALDPGSVAQVHDYVAANLRSALTVDDLARQTTLGVAAFARAFKKATKHTPYQYVLRLRIEHAQRLLALTHTPISFVALECGFANQAHLTRYFSRLIGVSPAAYRRACAV